MRSTASVFCSFSLLAAGGVGEILEGGKWGRLVPVDDADALARAVIEALERPHRGAAVERAQAFALELVIDEYADVLGIPLQEA